MSTTDPYIVMPRKILIDLFKQIMIDDLFDAPVYCDFADAMSDKLKSLAAREKYYKENVSKE